MKVKLFFLILFAGFQVLAQDTLVNASESKTNPVIFTEVYFGGAGSDNGGLLLVGYNLNYQFRKNDLLTARFNGLLGLYQNFIVVSPLLVLPVSERKEIQKEFALLYGKRWTIDNYSFSASAGISYTDRDYYEKVGGYYEELNQDYVIASVFDERVVANVSEKVKEACIKVNSIENIADDLLSNSMVELFETNDAINIIKVSSVLNYLEVVTDKAEDVANTIENIMIKYA